MQTDYQKQWVANNRDKVHAAQKKHREKRKENPEQLADYKATQRGYRNTNYGRASRLYFGSLKRAKSLSLEHNLDIEWIKEKLDAGFCEVTKIPFELTEGRNPFAPSLDKTDPEKGYTKENTKVVCWCYNTAKGNWSHQDVLKLAKALYVNSLQ